MNDFTGFTYCGLHSFDDLHIVRVSNGSRYSETLTPAFQDVTAQVPGMDGTLYWESFYTNRTHTIQFAFDNLSETALRNLKVVFNGKAAGWLIYDEVPFKKYWAKVQSPPQINYICFDEGGARVYKGEGTIQLISYNPPYAQSVHKYLDEFTDAAYLNKSEWAAASGMKATKGSYDGTSATVITVFNGGDVEADWKAYFPISASGSSLTSLTLKQGNTTLGTLGFANIARQSSADTYICINSRTNLIEGCKMVGTEFVTTGSLYNKFKTSGDFFKIPLGGDYTFNSNVACTRVDYDYLYY